MQLQATTNSDGYKLGHADMYAEGTTKVYSNLTPRTDKIYSQKATQFYDGKLVFFGAQGAIAEIVEMWDQSFFHTRKDKAIERFTPRVDAYLGEGVVTADRLAALHDLGYLPLEIKTLDEGSKVPMGIPVLTITNTVDEHFWLVNYLETVTSNLTWKGSTNATIAAEYKAIRLAFPGVYDADVVQTIKGDRGKLGTVSVYQAYPHELSGVYSQVGLIYNLYGQYNYGYDSRGYTDYEALESAMTAMRDDLLTGNNLSRVGFPKIGAGLGGGDWETIEDIIIRVFDGFDVTVYVK